MKLPRSATTPWFRHPEPWLLFAAPIAAVIAGGITWWIAAHTNNSLVVDDYYKQGKAINQDLRRDRVAASMGLSLTLRFDVATGTLLGPVRGIDNTAALSLLLVHPTVPAKDRRMVAVPDAQGNFSIALPLLERALWQVQLEDSARTWRLHGNWAWPQQQNTDIQAVPNTDRNARGGG